ncbi:MAG: AAA family ATPase [Eudoraea sp.]|nr:AAA family ATPase [Eudoraea sp.]
MPKSVLNTEFKYENNWIRFRETSEEGSSQRILFKEIRPEFINITESWEKEDRLKRSLDAILHLEEFSSATSTENQKAYYIPTGSSLVSIISENKITMSERLKIASEIIKIILEVHSKEFIFCDLNPGLFWCDLIDEKIFLIDTVMTVHFKDVAEFHPTIMRIEPHMLCMAPEQSMRTSTIPDNRSNYYSLGIILYALFTGKFPLESNDRISTIHKHLTMLPPDPRLVNKDICSSLGAFILKLLSKDPKERYQSASGFLFDFEQCRALQLKNDLSTLIDLGTTDFPTHFNIPDSAFLRPESQKILSDLSESISGGEKHLAVIRGEEGSGVSNLLNTFFQDLDYDRFFVGSGTYSTIDTIPFKGLKDLTSDLLHQILMEDPVFIRELKEGMQESIGNISGVLIDFDKDFEYLFDSREVPDDLIGNAAINRFIYAYTEFLRLLELQGKSIIISLERLELADVGTTKLLSQLLKSSFLNRFLIVISVHKDKTTFNQNCKVFMEGLDRNFDSAVPLRIKQIAIENYDLDSIHNILVTLKIEPKREFSKILFDKTKGNLSYIKQLFEELIAQDYIKANTNDLVWEVDIAAVQNIDVSDDVGRFLKNRIDQLQKDELYVLKGAMTMGQNIEVRQLRHILNLDDDKVDQLINSLRQKGFMTPLEYNDARLSKLKFSHSGFAEILREASSEQELERFNIDLVKALFKENNEDQIAFRLYELVAHLMPLRPENCVKYISYLEKAAFKAKKEAAFDNASQYFYKLAKIEQVNGNSNTDLVFNHVYEAALCALYAMKYTTYVSLLKQLQNAAATKNQGYHIYILKAIETVQQGNHTATLKVLNEGLQAMGIKFSLDITTTGIIKIFFMNIWNTRNLNSANVEKLPFNTDEKQAIYHKLINISSPAVYFVKPELTVRLTYIGIRDTVKNGLIQQTPYHLVALGFNMNGFSNMVAKSHELCKAGFKLLENKIPNSEVAILVNFLYSAFVEHTVKPLKECIATLEEYYKKGRELGNINTAHYCLGMARWYLLFDGYPMGKLTELLEASHRLSLDDNQKLIDNFHRNIKTLVNEMTRGNFTEDALDPDELQLCKGEFTLDEIEEDRLLLANLQLVKLIVITGNDDICKDKDLLKSLLNSTKQGGHGSINAIYHIFYALIHVFKAELSPSQIPKSQINKYLEIFKVRSKFAPFNYKVKYFLLLGLRADQGGKFKQAKSYYAEAYISSMEYKNPWDQALCCEFYGKYLINQGLRHAGLQKISEAVTYYNAWGAKSIANRILNQFQELTEFNTTNLSDVSLTLQTEQAKSSLHHLIQLGRSVHQQEDLYTMVSNLLDAVSEEASVDKAIFIIKNDQDFRIYAIKELGEKTIIRNISAEAATLPLSLLRFVDRRKSQLILGNACENPQYRNDPYIKENMTKSVMCIPFIRGNQTKSLIYLENSLLENVFEFTNIDLINLMYSQVAVAMENSILTELLEDKLQQRSLQILQEKEKADNLIKNILPAKVAEELKISGKVKAKKFDNVSVLFTDFKDFTLFSEKLTADQIIDELDRCFKSFDSIIEASGLEKIKTIGDAYMCAGGIPDQRPSHEYDIVNAGLQMLDYIERTNDDREKRGIPPLLLRVGIHAGPLIAGVVGSKKYAYDIWGPTVNIASRMESSSEAGMLNISGTMYLRVKDQFSCRYRGKIYAKNVGEIDMYFVENDLS